MPARTNPPGPAPEKRETLVLPARNPTTWVGRDTHAFFTMRLLSRPRTLFSLGLAATVCLLPGCMALIAGSGELDEDSVRQTQTKDQEDRMRRMREGGSVRPAEYDALNEKMGSGSGGEIAPKPSVEELERRVEENKRRRAEGN